MFILQFRVQNSVCVKCTTIFFSLVRNNCLVTSSYTRRNVKNSEFSFAFLTISYDSNKFPLLYAKYAPLEYGVVISCRIVIFPRSGARIRGVAAGDYLKKYVLKNADKTFYLFSSVLLKHWRTGGGTWSHKNFRRTFFFRVVRRHFCRAYERLRRSQQ